MVRVFFQEAFRKGTGMVLSVACGGGRGKTLHPQNEFS